MIAVDFKVLGEPVAKGRPRLAMIRGHAMAYTPAKTRRAESDIRAQIAQQLPAGFSPIEGAIELDIRVFRQRPKSLPKKVRHPVTRPDLDNYVKAYLDAMNSVVFRDDSQVVHLETSKEFGKDFVGAIISVREIE